MPADLGRYILNLNIADLTSAAGVNKDAAAVVPYDSRIVAAILTIRVAITGGPPSIALVNGITAVNYGATNISGAAGSKVLVITDVNNAVIRAGQSLLAQVTVNGATGGDEGSVTLLMDSLVHKPSDIILSWGAQDIAASGAAGESYVVMPCAGRIRRAWMTHPTVGTVAGSAITISHFTQSAETSLAAGPLGTAAGAVVEFSAVNRKEFARGDCIHTVCGGEMTDGGIYAITVQYERLDNTIAQGADVVIARNWRVGTNNTRAEFALPYGGLLRQTQHVCHLAGETSNTTLRMRINGAAQGSGIGFDFGDPEATVDDFGERYSIDGSSNPQGIPFEKNDTISVSSTGSTTNNPVGWATTEVMAAGFPGGT